MDKQRDQISNGPDAYGVAFSNSMMDDNCAEGSTNAGAADDRPDNFGPRNASTGTGADTPFRSGYALPPDPHAPPGDSNSINSAEMSDFGIADSTVGHNPHQSQYGLKK